MRRKTETILLRRPSKGRDAIGGTRIEGFETLQEALAEVSENVRAREENVGSFIQLSNSVSFTFYKDPAVDITPDLVVFWRDKRMTIQSCQVLNDVKKHKIIATYATN